MRRVRHCVWTLAACGAFWAGAFAAQGQGQAQDAAGKTTPKFEVASVRIMEERDKLPMAQQMFSMSPPGAGEFSMRNARLDNLIGWAFKAGGFSHPITGEPAWMDSTYYEVVARPEGDAGLSYDQLRPMVQELLKERFHLIYHTESRNAKGYALVIAKGGSKLKASQGAAQHAYMMTGRLDGANLPMSTVAELLAHAVGQAVVDETGLKGNYDMNLKYAPMEATDSAMPSVFTAVEEQLGLKLVKQEVPVEMFVIDHVDRVPTEN